MIAKANASRLAREVYLNQRKKELNKDQAARLNALNGALKPANITDLDRSQIDLIGLTGKLVFRRKQMLAMLAKSFALQDRALQYQYLQPPTTIDSLSLLAVLDGKVAPQQPGSKTDSVVVDLARGTFDASNMQLSDEMQVEFNRALKSYFVNNPTTAA